jgi:hypothetical protein
VFTLKHCFALKLFAAVHEAFSNTYLDKAILNTSKVQSMGEKISSLRKCLSMRGAHQVMRQPKL